MKKGKSVGIKILLLKAGELGSTPQMKLQQHHVEQGHINEVKSAYSVMPRELERNELKAEGRVGREQ